MDALHEFLPTIEVGDMEGNNLLCYQSLIIPRIGDNIFWKKDGIDMDARVVEVVHEIIDGNVVKCCRKVYINVDDVSEA